jgi:hypothetical protein
LAKKPRRKIPILPSIHAISGISNTTPMTSTIIKKLSMYESRVIVLGMASLIW